MCTKFYASSTDKRLLKNNYTCSFRKLKLSWTELASVFKTEMSRDRICIVVIVEKMTFSRMRSKFPRIFFVFKT